MGPPSGWGNSRSRVGCRRVGTMIVEDLSVFGSRYFGSCDSSSEIGWSNDPLVVEGTRSDDDDCDDDDGDDDSSPTTLLRSNLALPSDTVSNLTAIRGNSRVVVVAVAVVLGGGGGGGNVANRGGDMAITASFFTSKLFSPSSSCASLIPLSAMYCFRTASVQSV